MYNGHAYMDTMLHMDAADAVNFPVYMEGLGEESEWWSDDEAEGYTLWDTKMWSHFDNIFENIFS